MRSLHEIHETHPYRESNLCVCTSECFTYEITDFNKIWYWGSTLKITEKIKFYFTLFQYSETRCVSHYID
jgi:hypothetical protein